MRRDFSPQLATGRIPAELEPGDDFGEGMNCQIIQGDCLDRLRELPDASVHCCVTSPPYYGLRDYGVAGQLGLEKTPQEYVDNIVAVFREVRRVLRDDGTLWLNLGDSYARNGGEQGGCNRDLIHLEGSQKIMLKTPEGIKPKNLVGIPWRVALQADGWYLRQDIIWSKPNPMPESVTDRCTKSHEYIFLMSKSARYFYDAESISEPVAPSTIDRLSQSNLDQQNGSSRVPGKTNGNMKAVPPRFGGDKYGSSDAVENRTKSGNEYSIGNGTRNKRSVWTVATQPYSEAHFATFPPKLIKPCILAGCPIGGTTIDPFGGSGTTGMVALELGRNAILIELNPEYVKIAQQRTNVTPSML